MTKQTLKVLTGMALAGTLVATGAHNADAKEYKPEVKVENGKYFVRITDPEAKGKYAYFGWYSQKNKQAYYPLDTDKNYNNEFLELPLSFETNRSETASIQKGDLIIAAADEDGESVLNEDIKGSLGVKYDGETSKTSQTEINQQDKKQQEEETKKEEGKQRTQPQQGQNKNNELVKNQKQKQERAKKVEETQKQQTPQVEKKIDTAKKPLPKTTASSNTGLATFGGLSLISLMVFLGLRKKQK